MTMMMTNAASIIALALLASATSIAEEQLDIPTLVPPSGFDPNADAAVLNDALSVLFADENKLISVLCYRVFSQRAEITSVYDSNYGDLRRDLERKLGSGHFYNLIVQLTYDKSEYLAMRMYQAILSSAFDIYFNEPEITEILISRTNQELADMGTAYNNKYGRPLIGDIEAVVEGSLRDLYVLLAQGSRDEGSTVDTSMVDQDVLSLHNAGAGQIGTDKAVFVNIFASRNWLHLREVSKSYDAIYGSLERDVRLEFDGDMKNALLAILEYSGNKADYFATRLHGALISGLTVDTNDLDRMIVGRCETDLENIKLQYENIYPRSLSSAVELNTAGSYQAALLALIG